MQINQYQAASLNKLLPAQFRFICDDEMESSRKKFKKWKSKNPNKPLRPIKTQSNKPSKPIVSRE